MIYLYIWTFIVGIALQTHDQFIVMVSRHLLTALTVILLIRFKSSLRVRTLQSVHEFHNPFILGWEMFVLFWYFISQRRSILSGCACATGMCDFFVFCWRGVWWSVWSSFIHFICYSLLLFICWMTIMLSNQHCSVV